MPNNHVITKNIGNLRGFSTDSSYLRPPNVADVAVNIQKGPDGTIQLRRGYQCQIANIGGMGIGTFDDPAVDDIITVCVGTDGHVYEKVTKQIYLHYNGQITGNITAITNPSANLTQATSVGHGLITGTQILIKNMTGAVELNQPANFGLSFYTITKVDADHFILNGIDYTLLSPGPSAGQWSIYFADARYLTLSIYVDPTLLYSPTNQSINAEFIVNRAAQVNGAQNNTNTINVQFGQALINSNVVQFLDANGVSVQRNIVAFTPTAITIDGDPVSVMDKTYINQIITFVFGKGFEVIAPYSISDFITNATFPFLGVPGLSIAVNGDTTYSAAFIQILERTNIPSKTLYTLDYWYWVKVNETINPPLPGSANIKYQNSDEFENASLATYDDVIYIANGWDYPQKFDGQTVYRTGMPIGTRPFPVADSAGTAQPFTMGDKYQYAITYEQVDNRGHIVEGEISEITNYTVGATPKASQVTVTNLQSLVGANWNTNFALATGGATTPSPSYGPDSNGFYYATAAVSAGYTLKLGDSAYYADTRGATFSGVTATPTIVLPVLAGHGIFPGDTIYFYDSSAPPVKKQRLVDSVTATTVTIQGEPVSVENVTNPYILVYRVSKVYGPVAIVDGTQTGVNNIKVLSGYTLATTDTVEFVDSEGNLQRRTVTATPDGTHVTVSNTSVPVDVASGTLIYSTNATNVRATAITLQLRNNHVVTLGAGAPISNNLRINIYRTEKNQVFGVDGELFLVASIPNNGSGTGTQNFIDELTDAELGVQFDDPDLPPNPPPISKYLKAFGTQMFYAGGERGNPENSDRVFFSGVSGLLPNPEVVPLATNAFNVPNNDDDVTGIGVAGTTLVTTKTKSLWAATGNFLSGQIEVVQIAPGTNIGCISHASIASVGTLMYFLHTNGVYAITENQLYPTDAFGNPVPLSLAIDKIFRETNYLSWTKYVLKRSVGFNYSKDKQYLLFLPCEDSQSTIRTANSNSILLCYDYEGKNWFKWTNMNAAGGIVVIDDDLYFQERRYSGVGGNTANLYKQHRFYRLVDHADHAGPQRCEWRSSWEDLGQPRVRKKFSHCVLLMDRVSALYQKNEPEMTFSSYLDRIPDLQDTIASIVPVDNTRNADWSSSGWNWNYWSGYQDSFVQVSMKQGTVAKSMQVGFKIVGINMDIRFAGYQLEVIPENRKTFAR